MKDMLANLFLAGFGAMMITKDKAEEIVVELIQKGEVNRDEAGHIVNSLIEKGRSEHDNLKELIKTEVRKVMEEIGVPSAGDFEDMKKRVAALESRERKAGADS